MTLVMLQMLSQMEHRFLNPQVLVMMTNGSLIINLVFFAPIGENLPFGVEFTVRVLILLQHCSLHSGTLGVGSSGVCISTFESQPILSILLVLLQQVHLLVMVLDYLVLSQV